MNLCNPVLRMQPQGKRVRVAGLVVVHQAPPTAKNHHFITLETETGLLDIIVRPQVYTRYQHLLHTERLLMVEGVVQHQEGVVNLLALQTAPLPPLADISPES